MSHADEIAALTDTESFEHLLREGWLPSNGVVLTATPDPEVFLARDPAGSGTSYTVRRARTLIPRCDCPAGSHGIDCKHAIAVMELRLETSSEEEKKRMSEAVSSEGLVSRDEILRLGMNEEPAEPTQALAVSKPRAPSAAAVAQQRRDVLAMANASYADAFNLGKAMVAAGIAPQGVNAEQAAIVCMQAVDLNIPPMQAFNYIAVIKGRPFLMARMVAALVLRSGKGRIEQVERTPLVATARGIRPGQPPVTVSITMEMAQRAEWTKNPVYKSHPAAMLWARAVTTVGWMLWPDVLAGLDVAEDAEADSLWVVDPDAVPSSARVVENAEPSPSAAPAPAPPRASAPDWIDQLKEQAAAWDLRMPQFAAMLGTEAVSVKLLRSWAATLEGRDPFDAACEWARANLLKPAEAVEGEAWEIPAGQLAEDAEEAALA